MVPPEAELTILSNIPVYWELIESMYMYGTCTSERDTEVGGKKCFFFYFKLYTTVKTQRMT